MDEKIIIKSIKERRILMVFQAVCIAIATYYFLVPIFHYAKKPDNYWNSFYLYVTKGSSLPEKCWRITLVMIIIVAVVSLMYGRMALTVTDKRVYGTAIFGKRVDLPLDSISAVGTGIFKTIAVTSSSGAIRFRMIKNYKEIHAEISKLLVERQNHKRPVAPTTSGQEVPQSNADELKKYKDLLDNGVISQEEFDAKKKQLLGL